MAFALVQQPARRQSFPIAALFAREVAAKLSSAWFFLLASAACMIAALYGGGFQSGFETETLLVTSNPVAMVNAIVVVFLAIMLGTRLAAGLAWEREHGTLEVLFISPAGPRSIVYAKFAAEFVVLSVLLLVYAAFLLVAQPLGAGVIRFADVSALATGVVLVLPAMALGLLVSCFFSSVRGAVVAYLVIIALAVALQALLLMLEVSQPQDMSLAMLYLRAVLESANLGIGLVSAAAPLSDLVRSAMEQIVIGPWKLGAAAVLTLATVLLAGETMRVRGGI